MNVVVLTPIRLLGDGLSACFDCREEICIVAIVEDLSALRQTLAHTPTDLVLIDVTHGVELYDVRSIAVEHPSVALVALGLTEQRQEVIRCGRAGFAGYVTRNASLDGLCKALSDVIQGRLTCPAEISGGLLRALFRMDQASDAMALDQSITRRECDVLQLISKGLSNKEIARELSLSIATVKHHVHNILEKLNLPRRAQVMRRVRDAPWLAMPMDASHSHKADEQVRR
jgi:DNA-binding NarL/FixJ family response regulator